MSGDRRYVVGFWQEKKMRNLCFGNDPANPVTRVTSSTHAKSSINHELFHAFSSYAFIKAKLEE